MAKQVGPLFFTGTIDGVIFYKLNGQYYLRSKGDYKSGKQMRKDPTYKRTMEKADQFGAVVKMVKPIYYRYLPKAVRKHGLFGKLTGMVNRWMQEGKSKDEAKESLIAYCQTLSTGMDKKTNNQQSPTNQHQPTVNEQRSTINQQRTAPNDHRLATTPRPKQARYLSCWKVKASGHLQVPGPDVPSLLVNGPTDGKANTDQNE